MASRASVHSVSLRVSDISNIDFKAFFKNLQLKGLTKIRNCNIDNISINISMCVAAGSEIYNSEERITNRFEKGAR